MKDIEPKTTFGVWLTSCPRRMQKKAAEILIPHLGIVGAEWQLANAGGRCIMTFWTRRDAETLASALRAVGCKASAGETAPWP